MIDGRKSQGRPRINPGIEREEMRPENKWTMKAGNNWDNVEDFETDDNPDRLHIPRNEIPDGMDMLWVTDSVYGQPVPERRAQFEKKGWTPVHQVDFDGRFDGRWMLKGREGEIKMDGSVLMTRPLELSIRAKQRERRAALEQVAIKEQAITGGDLNTSLDSRHQSALKSNRINKSYERIQIPED